MDMDIVYKLSIYDYLFDYIYISKDVNTLFDLFFILFESNCISIST